MACSLRSCVLLAASLVVGAVLTVPGVARGADTNTRLSATAMTTALRKVAATSAAAAGEGWRASMRTEARRGLAGTYIVDPVGEVASSQLRLGTRRKVSHAVAGEGVYAFVNDAGTRKATTLIGRPQVRYAFEPMDVDLSDYIELNVASPATVLTEGAGHAGTRTTHADGSADYRYTADRGVRVTLHVDGSGVLSSARRTTSKSMLGLSYRYGAQHVTLPSAAVTVDRSTLRRATAYLTMVTAVKRLATKGAQITLSAADGDEVRVSSLRRLVRGLVASWNSAGSDGVRVKVGKHSGGVLLAATNPWNHRTVSYAVTAAGPEVLVTRL